MKWHKIVLEANLTLAQAMQEFGIEQIPDLITLKKLYNQLSMKNHPDRGGNTEKMQSINVSYELLKHNVGANLQAKSSETIRKDLTEQWKRAAYIVKGLVESAFDMHTFQKYFEEIYNQKFDIKSELYNPEKDHYNQSVVNRYEFTSEDREIVLYLYISANTSVLMNKVLLAGDESLVDMLVSTKILYNRREIKLTNKSYNYHSDKKSLSNPEVIFPRNKLEIKKETSKNQKVSRKDFDLTFEKNLKGDKSDPWMYIPFNDDKNSVAMTRNVFMRSGYWSIKDITENKFMEKYNYTSRHALKVTLPYETLFENAETLDFMTNMFKHIQSGHKTVDEVKHYIEQQLKIYKETIGKHE